MNTVAIMYDFDFTLAPGFIQEHKLLKHFNIENNEFWKKSNQIITDYKMDDVLAYMYLIVKSAKENKIKLTRNFLQSCGEGCTYYNGVENWFDRINAYGKKLGLNVEHYIISSATQEVLEGTSIAKHFKKIYGSSFSYDEKGEAFWPGKMIDYTLKTQYIFRIKKGKLDQFNREDSINYKLPTKKTLPYSNMLFLGDGQTDIPSMKIIKDKGGTSFCIYEENEKSKATAKRIFKDERVNFIAPADYSENSKIDKLVKSQLEIISQH